MSEPVHFVVVAADPLRRLWPVSDNSRSFSFVPGAEGKSPVERTLASIHALDPSSTVTIVSRERLLEPAQIAAHETGFGNANHILIDGQVSFAVLSILVATLAKAEGQSAKLVFLPGSLLASSRKRLSQTMRTLADFQTGDNGDVGVLVAPFAKKTTHLKNAESDETNSRARWVSLQQSQLRDLDQANNGSHRDGDLSVVGPFVAEPEPLISLATIAAPTVTQACKNAVMMAPKSATNITLPNSSFLTLVGDTPFSALFPIRTHRLRGLTVDQNHISVATDWENELARALSANTLRSTAIMVAGFDTARRIEFDGKTLLLNPGFEHLVDLPEPLSDEQADQDQALQLPSYKLLATGQGTEAWLLDLPADTATQHECHFTRTEKVTVISGTVSIRIERELFRLKSGQQTSISPGLAHAIENRSKQPAKLLEIRIGNILDDDDRLFIPQKSDSVDAKA